MFSFFADLATERFMVYNEHEPWEGSALSPALVRPNTGPAPAPSLSFQHLLKERSALKVTVSASSPDPV